jgi:hypothetical protein
VAQTQLLGLQALALSGVLIGALVRGRLALSWCFGAYLALGVAHKVWQLGRGAPDHWLAWLAVDLLQGIFCVAALVEIAARAFHRGLPGGRQTVARRFLAVLAMSLVLALAWGLSLDPRNAGEWYDALVELSRRLALTVLVLATILLGFAARVWTLDPWHFGIALGLWLYNAAVAMLSPRLGIPFPPSWPVAVYWLLLAGWLWSAWRPDTQPTWSTGILRLVWPWRA